MKRTRTLLTTGAAIIVLAVAARGLLRKPAQADTQHHRPQVAVETAQAVKADVPIYLQGLGTVQAFYTVTVTARVDGELQKIGFTEGQRVHKGDLLAQIDPRPNQAAYEQAVATKAKDAAQLANAKRDFERYTVLQPEDLASKQTVDTQRAAVDQLTAQLRVDQAQIDNAHTQLEYTRIVSPIDGRTGIRLVDPGNIVHAADTTGIVVVTQVQPITVIFTLPEEDLGAVATALEAGPVKVTTERRGGGEPLDSGMLTLIDNQIEQATGSVKLKAVFENAHNRLWPGQFVNAKVLVRIDRNATTIPSSAVQLGPNGPFTYVVKSDSTVEARPLKVSEEIDGIAVVTNGLDLHETVVTTNQYRLQVGTGVRTSSAARNRTGQRRKQVALSISAPFVQRPIATSLLMGGIFLVGLVVYPLLPVAPLPQVDFPTVSVSASLPGASPETMASSVATPLEYQFAQISGLSQMTSSNVLGSTQITLQFDLNRSIDAAAQDVQTGIDAAGGQLPKNLPTPPTYRKVNPADSPILILSVHSDVLPVIAVDDYAENILAQQISQIPGVGQVTIGGQQKPAVRVQVDPVKLASLGLQMEDVAGVIASATVDAPKGSINGPKRSLTIYDNDQLLKAAPWNDVVVAYKNGAAIRIRDIGVAVGGPENRLLTAWQNGRNGILLLIFKGPGANVIDAEQRVETLLPHAMASVPASVKVDIVANRTTTINAAVKDVEFTLVLTIVLVVMVIFLFLRNLWATIIPGLTVPLALLGTAAMMYVLNYSLDNLSLMALTIAVGFVVDDAIVMLENIYRHIEAGLSPLEASLKGASEVGFTILTISISLVAVFIPLLLMSGIIGRLFREFAVTMSMTIAVSAFVALTLSPTMCALFLRDEKHAQHGRAYMAVERAFDRLLAFYTRGLDQALDHPRITMSVFMLTVALTIFLYVEIPKGFFPQQDTGIISGLSDAPQDISFDEMVRRQHALMDIVAQDPDVASYGTGLGGSRPLNNGFVIIGLKPRDERSSNADEVINRLRPKLAQVAGATLFMQAAQDLNVGGRISRTQYQYTVQDSDINELNDWAPRLLAEMQKLSVLRDVASDQQTTSGMLSLTIDRDQASRFGILPSVIDQALYDAFGQRQAAQFFTQANSYHVILEIAPELQADPASLQKIYLKSPVTGQMVPLSAMTHYDTQHVTYLSINHQGQFPAVTLSFNLAPGAALGDAVDAIERTSAQLKLPATITGTFQGTAQAFQSSLKTQPYLILAALVAVYIILGMLYESYIHPLTILSTLPSAGVGALLILFIFHIDLSVMALIGIILLIGIVKKNGIMMVDFAIQAEREQHLTPHDAIRQACLLRFRPIMMTTMAALLGALPLALGRGTGSELRQPLGYTMVGGLIVSQALTLFTTPVVYLYLDRFSLWLKRRRKAQPVEDAKAAQASQFT